MLLLGGLIGGLVVWGNTRKRMHDPAFLQEQLNRVNPKSGKPNSKPPAPVRVDVAQRKSIRPQKSIIGRLVEVRKVTVASEVTGKIIDLPVEEGTRVDEKKTVLAVVDEIWCSLALDRCRAQAASTQARLDFERLELKRFQELEDGYVVSQSELESKLATVDELEATLNATEAAVKEGVKRLERSKIIAPFDGTVIAKHVDLGGHVAPGTPIVDIVSRGQVDARLMVPESVVNLIRVGQKLPIRIDPLGEEVPGTVVSVTPYAPSASRTFPVRVRLDDQKGRLKAGMSITAIIDTAPAREALVVSKDAVLVRPDGSTVWVAVGGDDGRPAEVHPVPVTITARMENEYAVEPETAEGRRLLTAGSRVVIEGAERLTRNQQVGIVDQAAGPGEPPGNPRGNPTSPSGQAARGPASQRKG